MQPICNNITGTHRGIQATLKLGAVWSPIDLQNVTVTTGVCVPMVPITSFPCRLFVRCMFVYSESFHDLYVPMSCNQPKIMNQINWDPFFCKGNWLSSIFKFNFIYRTTVVTYNALMTSLAKVLCFNLTSWSWPIYPIHEKKNWLNSNTFIILSIAGSTSWNTKPKHPIINTDVSHIVRGSYR